MTTPVICGQCGALMELKLGPYGPFYGCSTHPKCKGKHGAHPDGRPLGVPADEATRKARVRAHEVFDALWKHGAVTGAEHVVPAMSRGEAYAWLAKQEGVGAGHMGSMTLEQCERVIALCAALPRK